VNATMREQSALELEHLREAIALLRVQRANALMTSPWVAVGDLQAAIGLSRSMMHRLWVNGMGPPVVHVGARAFCRTADLRSWIQSLQTTTGATAGIDDDDNDADAPPPTAIRPTLGTSLTAAAHPRR